MAILFNLLRPPGLSSYYYMVSEPAIGLTAAIPGNCGRLSLPALSPEGVLALFDGFFKSFNDANLPAEAPATIGHQRSLDDMHERDSAQKEAEAEKSMLDEAFKAKTDVCTGKLSHLIPHASRAQPCSISANAPNQHQDWARPKGQDSLALIKVKGPAQASSTSQDYGQSNVGGSCTCPPPAMLSPEEVLSACLPPTDAADDSPMQDIVCGPNPLGSKGSYAPESLASTSLMVLHCTEECPINNPDCSSPRGIDSLILHGHALQACKGYNQARFQNKGGDLMFFNGGSNMLLSDGHDPSNSEGSVRALINGHAPHQLNDSDLIFPNGLDAAQVVQLLAAQSANQSSQVEASATHNAAFAILKTALPAPPNMPEGNPVHAYLLNDAYTMDGPGAPVLNVKKEVLTLFILQNQDPANGLSEGLYEALQEVSSLPQENTVPLITEAQNQKAYYSVDNRSGLDSDLSKINNPEVRPVMALPCAQDSHGYNAAKPYVPGELLSDGHDQLHLKGFTAAFTTSSLSAQSLGGNICKIDSHDHPIPYCANLLHSVPAPLQATHVRFFFSIQSHARGDHLEVQNPDAKCLSFSLIQEGEYDAVVPQVHKEAHKKLEDAPQTASSDCMFVVTIQTKPAARVKKKSELSIFYVLKAQLDPGLTHL